MQNSSSAITLVVALILVLGLAACGQSTQSADQSSPEPPAATSTQTPQPPTPSATVAPTATTTSAPSPSTTPTATEPPTTTATPPPAITPLPLPIVPQVRAALRMTLVYDNTVYEPDLTSDWGFGAWIEYGGHTLLFDTGYSGAILLDNMEKLGLDPQAIEIVVLSHIHEDHTGGLSALLDLGLKPVVYAPGFFPRAFKDQVRAHTELVEVNAPLEIVPGVYSTGQMGDISEQGLIVTTAEGMVVITGCAHPGIVNMLYRAQSVVDDEITLAVGGFHLGQSSVSKVEGIIERFRDYGVQRVSPVHCTGERAIEMFAAEYGDDYIEGGVGQVYVVGANSAPEARGFVLEKVGFSTPESALYDAEADLYLVSNIEGIADAKDGNGFISRVSPDGALLDLKWIDGRMTGVTLHAPKGMALVGDALYVADIDAVRIFDRYSGASLGAVEVPGAAFLIDVAAAPDGTLYVSDYTTRAIYRIAPDRSVEEFARGTWLGRPNGLVLSDGQLLVADSQGKRIHELDESGQPLAERELPQGGFDGLVLLEDGTLLVASWDASAIYRLAPDGQVSELFGKITAPADIGLDTKRGLVLIPFFKHNRLEARPLP